MFIYKKKSAIGLSDIVKLEGTKHFTLYTVLYEIKLQAKHYTRCTCTPYTIHVVHYTRCTCTLYTFYIYTIHIVHLQYTHCTCTLFTFYM